MRKETILGEPARLAGIPFGEENGGFATPEAEFEAVLQLLKRNERVRCPICKHELIYALFIKDNLRYTVFVCDCHQNDPDIQRQVVLAREWDDAGVIFTEEK